jgi:hypothetical protein
MKKESYSITCKERHHYELVKGWNKNFGRYQNLNTDTETDTKTGIKTGIETGTKTGTETDLKIDTDTKR